MMYIFMLIIPLYSLGFDTKLDDGNPVSGTVIAVNQSNSNACTCVSSNSSSGLNCVLLIRTSGI